MFNRPDNLRTAYLTDRLVIILLRQPVGITTDEFSNDTITFKHQRTGNHIIEKGTVMTDQQQGTVIVHQQFFKQLQRFHIQIIGRLVHNQQVRRLRKQPRQQQAIALTAGQGTGR